MISLEVHSIATDSEREKFFVVLTGQDEGHQHWFPVRIDPRDAVSIAAELEEQSAERPGTHDLIMKSLGELDATLERVEIKRDDKGLLARVYLQPAGSGEGEPEHRVLDARPSDALALAVRSGCDIQVNRDLLKESLWGENLEEQVRNRHPSDEVTRLQVELQEAIEAEEYERASELKDRIRDAVRRHEESLEDLDEDLDQELERAYRGEREASQEDELVEPGEEPQQGD